VARPDKEAKMRRLLIGCLLVLILLASVGCGPYKPKVGHTVRVNCWRPGFAGMWIEDGNIVLVDQVDPLGNIVGKIPCGTVVTIIEIDEGYWGGNESYFVVPLDKELPSGWICHLVAEDFIKFEKYKQ